MQKWLISSLVVLSAAAAPAQDLSPARGPSACSPAGESAAAGPPPLFYRYQPALDGSDAPRLEVRAFHGGRLVSTETIVPKGDQPDPVVELFSRNPDVLARLLALSRGEEGVVSLEITSPDGSFRVASLEELMRESRERSPGLPETIDSGLELAGEPGVERPGRAATLARGDVGVLAYCEDCASRRDACYGNCGGHPQCYAGCDAEYDWCRNNCTPRGCEPWSRTYTTSEVSGRWTIRTKCLKERGEDDIWRKEYDEKRTEYKHTTYRETHHCDGRVTTEVIGVGYGWQDCWERKPWSCPWLEGEVAWYELC